MGQNERKSASYPLNAEEWRETINRALNLAPDEGAAHHQNNTFPYKELEAWIRQKFQPADGFASDFIPALIRNIRGLVTWVYGGGSEPRWPSQDKP